MKHRLLRASGYKLVREPTPDLPTVQKQREMTAWEMLEEAKRRRAAQLQSMQENQEAKQVPDKEVNDDGADEAKPEFNVHMQLFGFSSPAVAVETERARRQESNKDLLKSSLLQVIDYDIKEEVEHLKAQEREAEGQDSDASSVDWDEDDARPPPETRLTRELKSMKCLIISPVSKGHESEIEEKNSTVESDARRKALHKDWIFASTLQMSHLRKLGENVPWDPKEAPRLVDEDDPSGLPTKMPEYRLYSHSGGELRLRPPGGYQCAFCWEPWKHKDVVCKLKCGHVFHSSELHTWLQEERWCPICRVFAESPDPKKMSQVVF